MNTNTFRKFLLFPSALGLFTLSACTSSENNAEKINDTTYPERVQQIQVPECYTVEVVAGPDLVEYPMFGTLDERGRLFLF